MKVLQITCAFGRQEVKNFQVNYKCCKDRTFHRGLNSYCLVCSKPFNNKTEQEIGCHRECEDKMEKGRELRACTYCQKYIDVDSKWCNYCAATFPFERNPEFPVLKQLADDVLKSEKPKVLCAACGHELEVERSYISVEHACDYWKFTRSLASGKVKGGEDLGFEEKVKSYDELTSQLNSLQQLINVVQAQAQRNHARIYWYEKENKKLQKKYIAAKEFVEKCLEEKKDGNEKGS